MKVLVTPRPYFEKGEEEISLLKKKGIEVVVNDLGRRYTKEELNCLIKDVDGIITGNDLLSAEILRDARKLKIISKYGVGLDNIDLDYAQKKGIKVCKALGANTISVAESTMMMILTSLRKYVELCFNSKNGNELRIIGYEANGKTLGIIGLGAIGRKVAQYANVFGMKVIGYDPYVSQENVDDFIVVSSFDEVIRNSDVITLHLPLTDSTKDIIDEKAISNMKDGVIIVNTARGGLIDNEALLESLRSGKVSFVSEDVELKERSEEIKQNSLYNITPHAASFTVEADKNTMRIAVENIINNLEV